MMTAAMPLLSKLLRAGEGRVMKDLQALVARVNALEAEVMRPIFWVEYFIDSTIAFHNVCCSDVVLRRLPVIER